jgi:hypothetical protein
MRKRGDTAVLGTPVAMTPGGIAKKKPAARPSRAVEAAPSGSDVPTASDCCRDTDRNASPAAAIDRHGGGNHMSATQCLASNPTSREASATPVESDLLRYLSAHIAPQAAAAAHTHAEEGETAPPDSITSFDIGRDEYLQGVLRLVKSDCPEVMHDMSCFVAAMQNAFAHVYNESRSQA